ncbi:RNA methyltransferase [bacterium]|jgi:hypothetical protein|nr:RNA methyltransferase [bacterium]
MGFDEGTVQRIRDELFNFDIMFEEKKMFGGMAFLYEGKMAFGVIGDQFVVRLHPDQQETALETYDYASPMDFTGRPMKGFLYLSSADMDEDADVHKWLQKSFEYVKSLPPKKLKVKKLKKKNA